MFLPQGYSAKSGIQSLNANERDSDAYRLSKGEFHGSAGLNGKLTFEVDYCKSNRESRTGLNQLWSDRGPGSRQFM